MSKKDFKVAIVGAGVCGVACAIMLAQQGVDVEIFESTSRFGEIGAGIGLGPNSIRILKDLGVFDDVFKRSGEEDLNMVAYRYISGMEGHELFYDYPLLEEQDRGLGIARSSLLDGLVKHIDPSLVHFNKRCTDVTQSPDNVGRSILHFQDGSHAEADLVIGADGIKSKVRSVAFGSTSNATFSNTVAYRGLVSYDKLKDAGIGTDLSGGIVCFIGKDKHIITYPIRGGKVINVVAFVTVGEVLKGEALPRSSWVVPATTKELSTDYEGWGRDVSILISQLSDVNKWSIHVIHPPMKSYVHGRIALIGDAAHAMFTHLGAGAGQGLEDGYLLARLLSHPATNASNLTAVLQTYDEIRRPRAQDVWERSYNSGEATEGRGPHGYSPEGIRMDVADMFSPVWHHDLSEDIDIAKRQLHDRGAF
ncbi:FAD/NAD(P)-binding domain-containing protein [Abortiporus biennis]|nr:FAD/NAD(P)-binding domain-containing protein [Abortiporus biennis]